MSLPVEWAARQRIEDTGANYQLMGRGDRRETIYRNDLDRQAYLKPWPRTAKRRGGMCMLTTKRAMLRPAAEGGRITAGSSGGKARWPKRTGLSLGNSGARAGNGRICQRGARAIRKKWRSRRDGAGKRSCRSRGLPSACIWAAQTARRPNSIRGGKPPPRSPRTLSRKPGK